MKILGVRKIVDQGTLGEFLPFDTDQNAYGEVIPRVLKIFFGEVLDYHNPGLDLDNISLATDRSVSGLPGGSAVVLCDIFD